MASPEGVPLSRSTAASPPGPMTVLVRTVWSYWRQIHSLLASSGVASSASSVAAGFATGGISGACWRRARSAGTATGRS